MSVPQRISARVLVVDDEESVRDLCGRVLAGLGCEVQAAESAERALASLEKTHAEIVLADLGMPGVSGLGLLKAIRRKYPKTDVLVMTDLPMTPLGAQAVKLGAYECLRKPISPEDLNRVFARLLEQQNLKNENRLLREQLQTRQGLGSLVGTSPKMQKVYGLILKVAAKRHPVLILGESGTGKELVARAIHAYGPWHNKPFVPVDCGALSPTLIESELFGHVRGAFTGASQARAGLLAAAGAGTVFLDEVAELPVELQAKLLRALQEREFKPLGSDERVALAARVIAATNQDLDAAVKRGTLRKELYFRLNVVPIRLPPLRERKGDIPTLVQYFMDRYGGSDEGITGLSYEAMSRLMAYDWPGNVRELENCVQRALALGTGPQIEVHDLPSNLLHHLASGVSDEQVATLKDLERRAIVQALEATGGDRVRAARLLGIGKTTIYRKLKEYGLEDPSGTPSSS